MQWEKARGWELTDWVFAGAFALEPVDDGLPPHAAATRTRIAVAMMAASVRALANLTQSFRRLTRGSFFVMGSAGLADSATRRGRGRGRPAGPLCAFASCLGLYAGAGDISATGHVGRMSCRPTHTGGMRVLVVEDHTTLADRIAQGLRQAGMAVDTVYDGAAGLQAAAQTAYDVIVLDRDLPVVHGDQVCRTVAGSGPRILMLTAAADVDERVDGLELGADDYLPKPFVFVELVARVRALSRRAPSAPPVLRRGDLTVDRARHRAGRGSRPLSLTRKEFGILEMLMAADGALVSAEELIEHVWDANADPLSNIVSVTMTRLRRKLGDPPMIETVVGKGYRM